MCKQVVIRTNEKLLKSLSNHLDGRKNGAVIIRLEHNGTKIEILRTGEILIARKNMFWSIKWEEY